MFNHARRRLLLVVAALSVMAGLGGPAFATHGSGAVGYHERNVWAGYREPPVAVDTPAVGLPRNPTRFCVRLPLPNQEQPPSGRDSYSAAAMRELAAHTVLDFSPGAAHTLMCFEVGDDVPYLVTISVWNPSDPTDGNTTTIEGVEAFARELLRMPAPALVSSPPAGRLITGLETWFGVAAAPVAPRSAQAGPLWATAEAVGVAVEIDPGDDRGVVACILDTNTRDVAVVPEVAPSCLRHTYTRVDRRTGLVTHVVRARVRYDVYLTTSEDPSRRFVDSVFGDEVALSVTVREIQTVLR